MRLTVLLAFAVLAGLPASNARASDDPCAEDVKRLCPDVQPGGGRVDACFQANEPSLSAACRDKRKSERELQKAFVQEFVDACGVDASRLCTGVKKGAGRVFECLAEHPDDISSSCEAVMDRTQEARTRVDAMRTICRADAERLCGGLTSSAGPLIVCLQEHEQDLSPGCTPRDPGTMAAVAFMNQVDQLASEDRIEQTLEILQGIDTAAFVRSQIALQFDNFQALGGQANANRLIFNPQFVFGNRNQFALIVKVPVLAVYPYTVSVGGQAVNPPPVTGLGPVQAGAAWAFFSRGPMKQFLAVGLQFQTAATPSLGSGWAIKPTYVIALGLARWVSLTTEISWLRSFAEQNGFPRIDILQLRPIVTIGLPAASFAALDTTLSWNLAQGGFVPIMKGVLGKFIDRQRSVSISAWFQGALTSEAVAQSYRYGFGLNLTYFFDW